MKLNIQKTTVRKINVSLIVLGTIFAMPTLSVGQSAPIFVDADAVGANDGTSWSDAYTDLQAALGAASFQEIWVAEGTYKPAGPGGNRAAAFQLKNNVALYGGFTGMEETRDERDWKTFETILCGDLNSDDLPGFINNSENSYHVVVGSGTDSSAILDGFTITAGFANGGSPNNLGAGMYNSFGSPTVSHCKFETNASNSSGGGMFNNRSSPAVTDCTFQGNRTLINGHGAGIYNNRSVSTVRDCTFTFNFADSNGGGIYNYRCSPNIHNCIFDGNTAYRGGGIATISVNGSTQAPMVINCRFTNNTASSWGGAVLNYTYANTRLINCTISGNSASVGGAVYNYNVSNTRIFNTILWNNSPDNIESFGSSPTLSYVFSADPVFVDPGQGDYRLSTGSPCVDAGNNARYPIDAPGFDLNGNPRFLDDPDISDTGSGAPPIIDIGAYEYDICPNDPNKTEPGICGCGVPDDDTDGDTVPDCIDICPGGDDNTDTDGDGVPDACDPCPNDNPDDSDSDGVCESDDVCPGGDDNMDTDGDGVPDACDPCTTTNPDDCNGNRIPDECEVPPIGSGPDCNANAIPDECETDCNGNSVPDECDIADCPLGDAACADCNGNGIPDECDSEFTDVALFVAQLLSDAPEPVLSCMYDSNHDGLFNAEDIQPFVARVIGL